MSSYPVARQGRRVTSFPGGARRAPGRSSRACSPRGCPRSRRDDPALPRATAARAHPTGRRLCRVAPSSPRPAEHTMGHGRWRRRGRTPELTRSRGGSPPVIFVSAEHPPVGCSIRPHRRRDPRSSRRTLTVAGSWPRRWPDPSASRLDPTRAFRGREFCIRGGKSSCSGATPGAPTRRPRTRGPRTSHGDFARDRGGRGNPSAAAGVSPPSPALGTQRGATEREAERCGTFGGRCFDG